MISGDSNKQFEGGAVESVKHCQSWAIEETKD